VLAVCKEEIMVRLILGLAFGLALAVPALAAQPQKTDNAEDKKLDVRSSIGDLHLGNDADAQKAGLPLYPGARLRRDEKSGNTFNLGVLTEAFGVKLVVANYDSDDAPGKIIAYYRERLKKYGKVIECHSSEHGGDAHAEMSDDEHSRALTCDGDNTGSVTELKVGTEDNQHVVAVEPNEGHGGSKFALVYIHARGKQGDI
jgi:hypothetical protein